MSDEEELRDLLKRALERSRELPADREAQPGLIAAAIEKAIFELGWYEGRVAKQRRDDGRTA